MRTTRSRATTIQIPSTVTIPYSPSLPIPQQPKSPHHSWRAARPPTPRRSTYPPYPSISRKRTSHSTSLQITITSPIPPIPPLSYWDPDTPSPSTPPQSLSSSKRSPRTSPFSPFSPGYGIPNVLAQILRTPCPSPPSPPPTTKQAPLSISKPRPFNTANDITTATAIADQAPKTSQHKKTIASPLLPLPSPSSPLSAVSMAWDCNGAATPVASVYYFPQTEGSATILSPRFLFPRKAPCVPSSSSTESRSSRSISSRGGKRWRRTRMWRMRERRFPSFSANGGSLGSLDTSVRSAVGGRSGATTRILKGSSACETQGGKRGAEDKRSFVEEHVLVDLGRLRGRSVYEGLVALKGMVDLDCRGRQRGGGGTRRGWGQDWRSGLSIED